MRDAGISLISMTNILPSWIFADAEILPTQKLYTVMNKIGILAGMALLIYFCAVTFQIIDGQSLHQSPFCNP